MGIRGKFLALLLLAGCAGTSKVEIAKTELVDQIAVVRTAMEDTYDVIPFACRTAEVDEGFDNIRIELDDLYARTENLWALHMAEVADMENDMWHGVLLGVILSLLVMFAFGPRR